MIGKAILIILAIVLMIVGGGYYFLVERENNVEFSYGNITISQDTYEGIKKEFSDYVHVRICNIESNECIALSKLKYMEDN